MKFAAPDRRPSFLRGEANGDGEVNLSDAVAVLRWLFAGTRAPRCLAAADTSGDGRIDLSDPVRLLRHLFLGAPPPVAPFPGCGLGELDSDRALGCEAPPACAE